MLCGTHLQQHLAEEERGFLVLCSTKETKPHYCYAQSGVQEVGVTIDNTLQEALGIAYVGKKCSRAVMPEMV